MEVKLALYEFCKEVGTEREEEILRGYLMGEEGGGRGRERGLREAEWLACTLTLYGIPPRQALALTEQSKKEKNRIANVECVCDQFCAATFPELVEKMESLHAPSSATVRLLPLMKSKLPHPLNVPFTVPYSETMRKCSDRFASDS